MVRITRIFFLFCLLSAAGHELTAQRVAWVVGNSEYVDGILPNPVNDAQLVSDSLVALGFEVRLDKNLATYGDFWSSWDELEPEIQNAEVFLFYYAGHGIQYENENYLIPTEAELQDERRIGNECFPIKSLINEYEKFTDSTAFVVVLDACRVNPFERKWSRSYGGGAGLSKVNPPTGTLVAYSTEYGTTAADGSGMYSAYAEAFAKSIGEPGRSLQESFQTIRKTVLELSQKRQIPVEENKLTERLVLRQLPDISMVEFQNILDDFEELLIRGFRENALITPDTLVGVEAAYELVSHYADEKVKLDSVSMLRFGELSFFNELYRLQSGLVLGSEHPGFDEVLKHVTISNQLVRLGDEFIRLLKLGEAGRTISIQEFENLNMQNPVLAFSTMYYVEELQSQFKGLKINSKFDGLLLSAFLESQLIISIELYVLTDQFAQIVQEMSSEAIIQLITRYDNFYDAVDGDDDRNYANSISCTMLVQTVSVFGSKAVGRSMEKFVEEKGVKAIKTWLMKPLDYDSQISTEFLELDLVDAFELLIPKSRVAEFERILIEFFDREWERSLSRCSGSYVDMMRVHDELVDLGYPDIQFVSPSKQVFSDSLVSKWSCFVSTYLQDEDLNDLHLTVSGFLNDQWALGYQDFTQAHISQETWLELLELELNLLRLTNRVSTSEFSTVAGIACAMTVDTWNSDELLNSANEIWQYLQVGKEMSEELGIWDYEYRVQSFVSEVLFMILPEDLNCDDLDELFEMVVKILGILVESELNDEVADCLLLMQEIVEVKGEGDCSGDGRNYDARRQRHKAILDAIETLNLSYPITKQLKDAYQLGAIEIGFFDYAIGLEFLDFRLKHKGSLCELDVLSLLDAIKVLQTVYKPFDKNAELEFYSINELYWLVSDLAVEYLTGDKESQCEILEASQMLLNEIRRIMKFGADRENRAQAAYRYASALQEFYHKTGQREEGADFIVQAGLEALKLMDNDWQIQELNYLLCEELSCSGEFDEAIFFRSLCLLDTSETWEQEDLWQFAQDQFIDEILSGNSAASNFEELWTAPELEDYDIAQTQCLVEQHNGYHQITIVDFPEGAFPLIEISKSTLEHETAMILKVEGKGYKIAELGAEFEFIGNRTDSLYSVCHTGAQGFLLPEKPDEYNGLDVWENHSFDGGNRVTSLRISEALFEAGSEVIRVGFYIKNPLPTGHTQDLKYITYMRSVD